MITDQHAQQLDDILLKYDPQKPEGTADELRDIWLQYEPKSMAGIKASLREQQETTGIPVPVLKTIGKQISKVAGKHVDAYLPLAQTLWDKFGREGRVIAVIIMGAMELTDPYKVIPIIEEMCRTCLTWEDVDRLAMDALEPIVRKKPVEWLPTMQPWLDDGNKWIRRASVIVLGRLPMKHPQFSRQCLSMIEQLIYDQDVDVKKAVSFAIRLVVRGEVSPVHELLARYIPPNDPKAAWVLCDVIRSMAKSFLPEFVDLLPLYEKWIESDALTSQDRRSIQSAIKTLKNA